MKRRVPTTALLFGALVAALTAALTPSAQAAPASQAPPPAQAAPVPPVTQARPVAVALATVAISAKTLTLTGTIRLAAGAAAVRSGGLWFSYPNARAATQVGTALARRPGLLVITARIDAGRIVPGPNRLELIDPVDGAEQPISLDLRRQSQISITHAEFRPHGQVALAVRVTHYDPKLDTLMPSRLSPVRLQELLAGNWVTLTTVTTDLSGLGGAVLPAGPGSHDYRAVRPDGATVLAATSLTVRARRGTAAITLVPGPLDRTSLTSGRIGGR